MPFTRPYVTVVLTLIFSISLFAQQTSTQQTAGAASQPASKDSAALATVQWAIAAMGGNTGVTISDSQALGTLTLPSSSGPMAISTVYMTKGTRQIRIELQKPSGTTVRIVNNGDGVILRPDGSVQHLLMNNTLAERVSHIPALSLLAENAEPVIKIDSLAYSTVAGSATKDVVLSRIPNMASPDASFYEQTTRHVFHIDSQSGLLLKMDYPNCAENDPGACSKVETLFTDYRNVSGIMVPFHQQTYIDGNLTSDLVLSSVKFNVGLSSSLFTLPQ